MVRQTLNVSKWNYWLVLTAEHIIDVSVSKKKDLNTAATPCYEGPNYAEAEFEKIGLDLSQQFGCTSPFVPKMFR